MQELYKKYFTGFVGVLGYPYNPNYSTGNYLNYEFCKEKIIEAYHNFNISRKHDRLEVYILCYNDELRLTKILTEDEYDEMKTPDCEDLILETLKYTDYVSIQIDPYDGTETVPQFHIGDNYTSVYRKFSDFEHKPNKFNVGDIVKVIANPYITWKAPKALEDSIFIILETPKTFRDPESEFFDWENEYRVKGYHSITDKDNIYYDPISADKERDYIHEWIHEDNLEFIFDKSFMED